MCDYSLAALPNRLAVEGEELTVYRFRTNSIGLAPPAEVRALATCSRRARSNGFWSWLKSVFEDAPKLPVTAVCVPPGAQLLFKNIPEELQRRWHVNDRESAVFVQVSAAENAYRDAVQFHDRRVVLLQNLCEGMLVKVLSLGGAEVSEEQSLLASQ